MYQERFYRSQFKGENLGFFNACVEQTDLTIGAPINLYDEAIECIKKYRNVLKSYIKKRPDFLTSLVPLEAFSGDPDIIVRMCKASRKAGVGPMASVAGAFSYYVGHELLKYTDEVIVENGGDIFIKANKIRKAGIYAGKSPLSNKLGIEIMPEKTPIGICTSSGTVGHSLSFGKSDAAVILSEDVFLADAVATAAGNHVKNSNDIEKAIDFASKIENVCGIVIIMGEKIGVWGDLKLIKC